MQHVFIFGPLAITSQHWEEDPEDGTHESGARVQVRRVQNVIVDGIRHRVGRDGVQPTIGEPVWRADLFSLVGGPPGNWDVAHHHPQFSGMVPCERERDPGLTRDPVGWTERHLRDLTATLDRSLDQAEVDRALPRILEAIAADLEGPRPELHDPLE